MMRRRGMPLMRVAATTAVVAGTAGAVSHHQQQKYAGKRRLCSSSKIWPISRVWLTRRRNNRSRRLRRNMRRAGAGPCARRA